MNQKSYPYISSKELSLHYIKHPKTFLCWLQIYCKIFFSIHSSKLRSWKSKIPIFLSDNCNCVEEIHSNCKNNLSTLSVERLHNHIHAIILPKIVKTIREKQNDVSFDVAKLLKEYNLTNISVRTVCTWMHKLGYMYGLRQKFYYVNNHKKPENIRYQNSFISRYFDYKFCCY